MATYVLIPGAGSDSWYWHLIVPELAARGHEVVAEGRDPDDEDLATLFLHDVPPEVVAASASRVRDQSGTPFEKPWPRHAWPDVPSRFLLCRHDRLFPADFQRRVVRERLGIVPDEMDGGHLPALARPRELAERLLAYRAEM